MESKKKLLIVKSVISLCLVFIAIGICSNQLESDASFMASQPVLVPPSPIVPLEEEEENVPVPLAQNLILEPETQSVEYSYVGELCAAAYSGSHEARTYSGLVPKQHHTVAAKLSAFEIGDKLLIDGALYEVEDKVNESAKEELRIYFNSNEDAKAFGRKTVSVYRKLEVFIAKDGYLGKFEVTGYCNCESCCGKKKEKLTRSETVPQSGYTIAVDPEVIALGTKIEVDGVTYMAEDTGKAILGNRLDIYFDTHEEALVYGRKMKDVYLK